MSFARLLNKIDQKVDLSRDETRLAFDSIFDGDIPAADIGALLVGLHEKGETVDEILGAVTSMRSKMISLEVPQNTMDICGTGGDSHGTLNVSTATALVVAGCGVSVAKHGNRAASSKSGSSDVLAALGVSLDAPKELLLECLHSAHICFLFAPHHHPAMRYVADVRRRLKTRTIFNLLGPLCNPANVTRHLIGVYDLEWLGPMAEVLKNLGSEAAWLTHGHDGMDEVTTTGCTDVVELQGNSIRHFTLEPTPLGLPVASIADLKGGDVAINAQAIKMLLKGAKGAYRDIVLLNASAALIVAGKAKDLPHGLALAGTSLDSGAALTALDTVVRITNGSIL